MVSSSSFALSYVLRPTGPLPYLLHSWGLWGNQFLSIISQEIGCICFASAPLMVFSFAEQHDSNRLGLGGHVVPSVPEVQECHHVGRPGFIKYYFLFQSR